MKYLVFVLALLACPATAEGLPSLHEVTNVSANDTLNIRAEPTTASRVVGALAANATGIEVVDRSEDGLWGQINHGESTGWVSLRYLSKADTATWPPQSLTCFGTEPFWTLEIGGQTATFDRPGGSTQSHQISGFTASGNRVDRFGFAGPTLSATVAAQSCSDGMSDRNFGLSIEVLQTTGQPMQYSGCCTLAP